MRSDYLSRDWRNDDPRHFAFVRNSRIPHGTFRRKRDPDVYVLIASAIIALVVVGLGWSGLL